MMAPDVTAVEKLAGSYSVAGEGPDGTAYVGTLELIRHGAFLHGQLSYTSSAEPRIGLAVPWAGRLVMAFGPRDKVEIGAYRIQGDQMSALWVPPGASGNDYAACGHEASARGRGDLWKISEAVAIDQAPYSGTIEITRAAAIARPTPVNIEWHLHDGDYRSFGLAFDDAMYTTFSFEPDKPHGVIVYERVNDEWRGKWITSAGMSLGVEVLRRV